MSFLHIVGAAFLPVVLKILKLMKSQNYRQILINNAVPSGTHVIGNNFIFEHNSDPNHTASAWIEKHS